MEVVPADAADARALAAILVAARRDAMPWLPELHTETETRRYIAERVICECEVLVALGEHGPIGFLALTGEMVEHLYVRPDAQGAGIGTALLEAAKARRAGGLRLWVFQRNRAGRAFYERNGFVEVELTDGADNEEREPDVLLAWSNQGPGGALAACPQGAPKSCT